MINILLYVSTGLIIFSFIGYFIMIMIGRINVVTKNSGFDVTKDIISEYNSINVIESKSYFTIYNIKRRVIKLATKSYYGNDLSSISLSLIEAGISMVDNKKNKYIDLFRKIFSNLKTLYIFPIVALFINNASYNVSDAKVSMMFIILFSIITYIMIDIKTCAYNFICDNLNKIKDISKNSCLKILNFINRLILLDKLIFLGELVIIIRLVAILLEFN